MEINLGGVLKIKEMTDSLISPTDPPTGRIKKRTVKTAAKIRITISAFPDPFLYEFLIGHLISVKT
jgi:hypothetical protein